MTAIDEYLKNVEEPQTSELEKIREIIKQIVPDTEETMSYGIPTIKYKGKNLIHFAAFKNHMSLFPGPKVIKLLGKKLDTFKISKGTIQFTKDSPIPESLIARMVKIRLDEIDN